MRRQVVFLVFALVAVISAAPAQNNTTQAPEPANTAEAKSDEPKQDAVTAKDEMDAWQGEAFMNKLLGEDFLKADASQDEEFMMMMFINVLQGVGLEDEEFMMESEDMLMMFDLDGEDEAALF